jgi:hypothetical protein
MRYFLSLLLLISIGCQSQNICVSVDCKDSIKYPAPITLNGSTSSTDGVKSRLWTITKGTATLNNPNVDTAIATAKSDGLYVFLLTGTSLKGAIGTAFDSVIYVANKPPISVVGQSVASTDGTAILSGSNSTDPEGQSITFNWTQLSGPTTAQIASPTMSNPIVSAMVNGTYVFTLVCTDAGGLKSAPSSQLVQVSTPITVIKTVTTVQTFYSDGSVKTVVTTVP